MYVKIDLLVFFLFQLFLSSTFLAQETPEVSINWGKQIEGHIAEIIAD